jgi:DNA polymerase I-like protein with 3'-5' exonuclease and polymerase domains
MDTETTSLDIIEAQLVWVSIYLDDENIYYINRLHDWDSVTDKELHNFLDFLLQADHLINWHNIKYDLQIIELFLKWSNLHESEENIKDEQKSLF